MNIQVIHEHSVDVSLLSGGVCIDVGCLGFEFSTAMRDRGCEVWAFDIQPMEAPEGIRFQHAAILHESSCVHYAVPADQQAANIFVDSGPECVSIPLWMLFNGMKLDSIDVLKLDCEGSEYLILSDPEFKPVPKQITVEFHMHAFPELHAKYYERCMENLLKYYVPVQHELTDRHCAGFNYWDSLFIRKDLVK